MKISISQSSVWTKYFSEREYYPEIRKCGFKHIDYNFYSFVGTDTSPYMGEDWQEQTYLTREAMDKAGISAVISHAPCGEPALDTEGISRRTIRSAEMCPILGIDRMVYHPGAIRGMSRKEYVDFNVSYVRRLLPALEKNGVTLLLENVGRWDEPFYSNDADGMLELIEAVNHPLYHACLDTGHLTLADGNQYETILKLGSHLMGLHIQDNLGSMPVQMLDKPWRQDLHLPPITAGVDFDEVMQALIKIGYRGPFNLEPEAPRAYDKANKYAVNPRLRVVSAPLATEFYRWVYNIAEYMLNTYGIETE